MDPMRGRREASERRGGGPWIMGRDGRRSPVPLGYLGLSPRNFFFKNQLINRVFSAYLQSEMVSTTVLARLSIRQYKDIA